MQISSSLTDPGYQTPPPTGGAVLRQDHLERERVAPPAEADSFTRSDREPGQESAGLYDRRGQTGAAGPTPDDGATVPDDST